VGAVTGSRSPKYLLWALLALPALPILYRAATEAGLWWEDLLHPTGLWSARLIVFALALTPLSMLLPKARWVRWLVRHRRAFGVAGFAYAALHLAVYVTAMGTIGDILAETGAPSIWTAWLAFLCLVPVALTSNDAAMRALRVGWKRLQRLAYPAAILTLAHWMLVHDGIRDALLTFAPLIALEIYRLARLGGPRFSIQRRMT
jgi:methionine sulfoxide reductase heme-binding subunit